MGNALILVLIATFGVVWSRFAHRGAWGLFRRLFLRSGWGLKGAWYWGLGSLTTGLLLSFAALGIALPPLLSNLFHSSQEVSVSLIAFAILLVLSLTWLVSLNRYRVCIEDFYDQK
jgi:hypothetical protein